jgi:hypothetical protein
MAVWGLVLGSFAFFAAVHLEGPPLARGIGRFAPTTLPAGTVDMVQMRRRSGMLKIWYAKDPDAIK